MTLSTDNFYGDHVRTARAADYTSLEDIDSDGYWLLKAEQCHRSSTDYLDINIRRQWERNLAHFNSEHSKDSKFYSLNYKNRNRLFRPKTRAIEIKGTAAFSRAMFSTAEMANVKPRDESNKLEVISAEINQELLNYRLKETIPWFQTALGAYQDTFNYGICISYQYWAFETRIVQTETQDIGQDGKLIVDEDVEIIRDEPAVDLIAPENFRFDAAADWRDPVGTSPFLERLVPLTLDEVLRKMTVDDHKTGKPPWRQYEIQEIISASDGFDEQESVRQAREGHQRQDPHYKELLPDLYQTVWCREYVMRDAGYDWVYWTIGHTLLLSDPVHIEQAYFHGKRPFVVGKSLIESHKTIPSSKNQLIAPIQTSINKLTNQRFDNVDLVLNKRYFMRRGSNVDVAAMMRNAPGGGVYMEDPERDVKVINTPDVTGSSYEEHNRLSNEMDEIAGNFSTSSVQSNQAMNETVGGMELNAGSSDEITEFGITVFMHTWVYPVLDQLVQLQQAYETDEVILALAAKNSKEYKKTNLNGYVPAQLLEQSLKMDVNAGIANIDPIRKTDRFTRALGAVFAIMPQAALRMEEDEVISELMGGAGRQDAERFFKPIEEMQQQQQQPSPEQQQLQADQQQREAEIEAKSQEVQAKLALEKYKVDQSTAVTMLDIEKRDEQFYAKLAADSDMTVDKMIANLGIEQKKLDQQLRMTQMVEKNKQNELIFKATTNRDGI